MDVNGADFIVGRRATRRSSYKLLSRVGTIIVASGSRHVLREGEVSTEALESRTQTSIEAFF